MSSINLQLMLLFRKASELKVGDIAPDFSLTATNGKNLSMRDFAGKWLVIYFYPKAFTPGCTKQSCALTQGYSQIKALGAEILGVSFDNVASQGKFKDKYRMPFELLADVDKKMSRAYGSVALGGLLGARKTFIIDPNGRVAQILTKIDVKNHDKQVIEALKALQSK